MLLRRVLLVLGGVMFAALAFLTGYAAYPLLHQGFSAAPLTGAASAAGDMSQYWQVWALLDRDFYGPQPDAQARTRGAIAGMVQTYGDPYTFWVEPQARELERDDLAGRFGGIGATIEQTPDAFVLHPLADQPAARAGVLDGDRLIAVDAQPITTSMDVNAVVALVRGPVGTTVTITVLRGDPAPGAQEPMDIAIQRAEIRTPSVEWRLLDDQPGGADIGYLKQTLFSERSADEMTQGIKELLAAGATRFIWDLRGNPGGLLDAAVSQADMWLERGLIVREEKAGGITNSFDATPGDLSGGADLVVLVDGGSASASEIVAGALQSHARATLIGQKTFGKGSVQLIHELSDQSSLHVTNGQWLTPDGRQISGNGLTPDIVVAEGEVALQAAIDTLNAVGGAQARNPEQDGSQ